MNVELGKKVLLPKIVGAGTALVGGAAAVLSNLNNIKNSEEVLDYMQYSPQALSAQSGVHMTSRGPREGESMEDFVARLHQGTEKKLTRHYEGFVDIFDFSCSDGNLVEDKKTLKEALGKMDNSKIRKIASNLYKNELLFDTTVELLVDINNKLKFIKDTKMLSFINKKLEELANFEFEYEKGETDFADYLDSDEEKEDYLNAAKMMEFISIESATKFEVLLNMVDRAIDTYNNIKGNYVTYKKYNYSCENGTVDYSPCKTQKFLEYFDNDEEDNPLRVELEKVIYDGESTRNLNIKDFITAQKTENFLEMIPSEERDYLYKVYLAQLDVSQAVKEKCKKIKEEFGTKIIPPSKNVATAAYFDFIEEELNAWKEAGGDKVKFPEVLNLNLIDERFLNGAEGHASSVTREIQLKGHRLANLRFALRHELMHLNDELEHIFNIGEDNVKLLNEIMPTKKLKGRTERDYANCKYKDEFLKAGVEPNHIFYAFEKRAELIAVAAEGDMSQYSPEFKEILKQLGMPEFAFNLKTVNPEIERRVEIMQRVTQKHPDEKDYNKLVKYYKQEERKRLSAEEKLLELLFGGKF